MSTSDKTLDIRFGDFACSIAGYDDPARVLRHVIRAVQDLAEEHPETTRLSVELTADTLDTLMIQLREGMDMPSEELSVVPSLTVLRASPAAEGGGTQAEAAPGASADLAPLEPGKPEAPAATVTTAVAAGAVAAAAVAASSGEAEEEDAAEAEPSEAEAPETEVTATEAIEAEEEDGTDEWDLGPSGADIDPEAFDGEDEQQPLVLSAGARDDTGTATDDEPPVEAEAADPADDGAEDEPADAPLSPGMLDAGPENVSLDDVLDTAAFSARASHPDGETLVGAETAAPEDAPAAMQEVEPPVDDRSSFLARAFAKVLGSDDAPTFSGTDSRPDEVAGDMAGDAPEDMAADFVEAEAELDEEAIPLTSAEEVIIEAPDRGDMETKAEEPGELTLTSSERADATEDDILSSLLDPGTPVADEAPEADEGAEPVAEEAGAGEEEPALNLFVDMADEQPATAPVFEPEPQMAPEPEREPEPAMAGGVEEEPSTSASDLRARLGLGGGHAAQEPAHPSPADMDFGLDEEPEAPGAAGGYHAGVARFGEATRLGTPEPEAEAAAETQAASGRDAADFAQDAKAETVPELLAAAAAYLTIEKKQTRFTRRDVMDVFDKIPGDQPRSLEARIKGFGRLVREGTLVLVEDGVFAMSQTARSRYRG